MAYFHRQNMDQEEGDSSTKHNNTVKYNSEWKPAWTGGHVQLFRSIFTTTFSLDSQWMNRNGSFHIWQINEKDMEQKKTKTEEKCSHLSDLCG